MVGMVTLLVRLQMIGTQLKLGETTKGMFWLMNREVQSQVSFWLEFK